jgi:crotonobetaine/carnitine-CoA ligase
LGGVIDILLRQPPQADDRNHSVTHGFGAGCRADAQHAFQDRFNIPLHELYGMTEASSFTTVNAAGVPGSIGLPLPWFEILLLDKDGVSVPNGEAGELVTVERQPGLITAGYYQNPDATSAAIRGERLHTGDLMRRDDAGNLYFLGRMTQSIRRRGENISSWEVEQALVLHPAIVECAVIGVDAEIGEQEIHAFMRIMSGQEASPPDIAHWCKTYMPPHHVPRYFTILDDFPRTPSLRIKRDGLADLTAEVWDREE